MITKLGETIHQTALDTFKSTPNWFESINLLHRKLVARGPCACSVLSLRHCSACKYERTDMLYSFYNSPRETGMFTTQLSQYIQEAHGFPLIWDMTRPLN
jgi:hypothetical protein